MFVSDTSDAVLTRLRQTARAHAHATNAACVAYLLRAARCTENEETCFVLLHINLNQLRLTLVCSDCRFRGGSRTPREPDATWQRKCKCSSSVSANARPSALDVLLRRCSDVMGASRSFLYHRPSAHVTAAPPRISSPPCLGAQHHCLLI